MGDDAEKRIREHLVSMKRESCSEAVPCFVRAAQVEMGESVPCACMLRYLQWLAFWTLVRGDLEGAPRLLPSHRFYATFTGPIFIFVCRGCGAREESWCVEHYSWQPVPPEHWYRYTRILTAEESYVMRYTVAEFAACSRECMKR